MTVTVESVVAVAWPDLRGMSRDAVAELERELVRRIQPSRVLERRGRVSGPGPARLDEWLLACAPKSAQDVAVVLTAVAALLTAVQGFEDEGKPLPETPPAISVVVVTPPAAPTSDGASGTQGR